MKKVLFLLIPLLLTGCWNYRELNNLAITTGVAIDKIDDEYTITIMIANSKKQNSPSKENTASTAIYNGKGKTIYQALKDTSLATSKQIYINHIEVLIVSEEIATNNMKEIMDLLFRYPQTRNEFDLIIAQNEQAGDVLEITTPLESFPSENIAKNLQISDKLQSYVYKVTYNEFVNLIIKEGTNPVLPSVYIVGEVESGNDEENIKKNKPDTYLKLGMMGIFRGTKFIKFANQEESEGINFINNKVQTAGIVIDCDKGKAVIEVKQIKTDRKLNLAEQPEITIDTVIGGDIQEVSCDRDLRDPKTIKEFEEKSEKKVKELIESALKLGKENKTDIFNFGQQIYQQDYKYWNNIKKDWNETIFPNAKIDTKVKVTIQNKGTINYEIKENT